MFGYMRYWVDMTGFWLFFTDSGALGSCSADFLYGRNAERLHVSCILSFPCAASNAVMNAVMAAALMGVPETRMTWMPGMVCRSSLMAVSVSPYGMAYSPSPVPAPIGVLARMPMSVLPADAANQPMRVPVPVSGHASVLMLMFMPAPMPAPMDGLSAPDPMGSPLSMMGMGMNADASAGGNGMGAVNTDVCSCSAVPSHRHASVRRQEDADRIKKMRGTMMRTVCTDHACGGCGMDASRMTADADAHPGAGVHTNMDTDMDTDADVCSGGSMGIMDGSWTRIRG